MPTTKPKSTSPRANIYFEEKNQALREDVHWLGELVGELVYEQSGEAIFDLVETARQLSIKHREGDARALSELRDLLRALAPSSAGDFIRGFSTYFQMVNMAEKVHRIRRRREYLQDASVHQPFGMLDTLQRLKSAGVGEEQAFALLSELSIEPVFTANLTETTRRTLLQKQQNIARHLVQMLDPYMTPTEVDAATGQIKLEMTTGWQTAEQPGERRPSDEAEHVLFFVTDVLYRMIPPLYESLESAIAQIYEQKTRRVSLPVIVRFSTWIGGDMDGDPTVTAKSIRDTLARHRALVLNLYYRECGELIRDLSQSETRCTVLSDIKSRSEQYAGHFPTAAHTVPARHAKMPYRVFLRLVQARLQSTFDDGAFPYESPDEFIDDIELIAKSLRENKGRNAGLFTINRLLRRAQTFGFHLCTLDLRQNALAHRRVIGEVLDEPDWLEHSSEERIARIKEALERRESPVGSLSSDARRAMSVFQTLSHARRRYGQNSIGSYIVRTAHGADDVLSVILLARWSRLGPKRAPVPLDIAPLFETTNELNTASEIMERLLGDDIYREHLKARGNRQTIVLGYSGGNRDGDAVSARWNLDKAQRALATTMRAHGVELSIFHARGGTFGRTASRVHEALRALPSEAVSNRLRMTEQGESINAKYGLRGIAMRSLEQLASALLWVRANPAGEPARRPEWYEIMADIAAASGAAYGRLVFDTPGFEDYFRGATPIDAIEQLGIMASEGSANASPIEGLHVIAWLLAWTQCRCLLPDWYGFSTGITAAIDKYGAERIRNMYNEWPFFKVLVNDIEVSLAKSDLDVAERYSQLAGDYHAQFFPEIRREFDQSIATVLALTGQSRLLESFDTLARSIRLRNPYVDPMSLLQVDLLSRWRAGARSDEVVLQALMASVNGITHAMQDA